MSIILLPVIFTVVSAVSFPARIEMIGFPLIPVKNDYFEESGSSTITALQDLTEDLGITFTYNLTQGDGQLVASEGPKLSCGNYKTPQFASMAFLMSTATNREKPDCPHPKGELKISREFTRDLTFDDLPVPSCDSNFTIDEQINAPDVELPILEMSFNIFPICNKDGDSD